MSDVMIALAIFGLPFALVWMDHLKQKREQERRRERTTHYLAGMLKSNRDLIRMCILSPLATMEMEDRPSVKIRLDRNAINGLYEIDQDTSDVVEMFE